MPDLPSGTVTILFTDIEGSTALWERDRRARAEVVVRHLALLRQAMKAHHGVLYAVVGDAVQATFVTASDGLSAVAAAHWAGPDRYPCAWHCTPAPQRRRPAGT